MPSTSKKQSSFMKAVANNPKFAKRVGVSQKVGKDFEMADKKMGKYAMGGDAKMERDRQKTGMKIAQVNKKMAGKEMDMMKAKGGMMADKMGRAMKKKSADTMGRAMKYAAGGLMGGHKSADGIAKKGKTKGTKIAMKRGGSC